MVTLCFIPTRMHARSGEAAIVGLSNRKFLECRLIVATTVTIGRRYQFWHPLQGGGASRHEILRELSSIWLTLEACFFLPGHASGCRQERLRLRRCLVTNLDQATLLEQSCAAGDRECRWTQHSYRTEGQGGDGAWWCVVFLDSECHSPDSVRHAASPAFAPLQFRETLSLSLNRADRSRFKQRGSLQRGGDGAPDETVEPVVVAALRS